MSNTKPIVVGVDGSEFSVHALRWAIREAHTTGTDVVAVMAWQPYAITPSTLPMPVLEPTVSEAETRGLREELDAVIARASTGLPEVPVRAELIAGPASKVLVDASRGARLLVLGSHGRGYLVTALIGSVALSCARDAHCPLLVLPRKVTAESGEAERELTTGPSAR
ncbi:universal stress protein [Allokutzneria albata]|uniref:Nucleotide-binding universal stress protein, UspA family n=1 Tax=Allokutzneria albata TaxID=211114 RepID=A0A1G9VKU6_ALLAB|nr:universal stress protein [Allokutzneria albata]SDM72842.1 Nucleotide-binding universal stress protein, UspA family [Allokutzneria albata]